MSNVIGNMIPYDSTFITNCSLQIIPRGIRHMEFIILSGIVAMYIPVSIDKKLPEYRWRS